MKKITDYRKLLEVNKDAELQELKTVYRSLMKTWHPDRFQDSEEDKLAAEEKSKAVIEAYHFLVSIAPEDIETRQRPNITPPLQARASLILNTKGRCLKYNFPMGVPTNISMCPKRCTAS